MTGCKPPGSTLTRSPTTIRQRQCGHRQPAHFVSAFAAWRTQQKQSRTIVLCFCCVFVSFGGLVMLKAGVYVMWIGVLPGFGVCKRIYRLVEDLGDGRWRAERQSAGVGVVRIAFGSEAWFVEDGCLPG